MPVLPGVPVTELEKFRPLTPASAALMTVPTLIAAELETTAAAPVMVSALPAAPLIV